MKLLIWPVILLATSAPVQAQTSDDVALCESSDTELEIRLAACDAVIVGGEFAGEPWPYDRRGDAYRDNDLYAEAIVDYSRSLEIDPNYPHGLRSRAGTYGDLKNYESALIDTQRLVKMEPDDYWSFYFHGYVLSKLERNPEARSALTRSIELRDDYFWSRRWLSFVLSDLGEFTEAAASMERARELEPFDADVYMRLGRLYRNDEKPALAARNFRIAVTLNPNFGSLRDDQVGEVPPTLPPLRYRAPAPGLQVQYLQVFVPRDMRGEMELAIQALADWFKPALKAMPEATAFMTRTMTASSDTVTMALRIDVEENMDQFIAPGATMPESVESFRGLFLNEMRPRGMDGPVFQVAYDGADPADLWPLKVGNEVNGTGRYLIICPDGFQIESMVLGCRIGMESVELGTLQYNLFVEKVETAFVPMGEYVSYVVRYRELGISRVGGREDTRETETRWWISPELNFWVKRTRVQGRNIETSIAVERFQN